ncbi:hypothetical protein B0H19DRAFT_972669, partial [Mycena capillaripes]
RCDEFNFDGTTKPHNQKRDSYNHAQKMRAAMTYALSRVCGLGSLPWHESEVTGRMVGNPSVSETVAMYPLMSTLSKFARDSHAVSRVTVTSSFVLGRRPLF